MGVVRISMPSFSYIRSIPGSFFSMVPGPFIMSIMGVSSHIALPSGVGTPLPFAVHSLMMEAAVTSRVSNGFMKATPSTLISCAPRERTFSVTSAPNICAGYATPVG